jgi:hypothetical protein
VSAQPLRAGRGGFERARGQPHLRPMHTATPGPVLGDPTSVEERPIGYGQAATDDSGHVWVESIEACPLVAVHVRDDDGKPLNMTGELSTFVAFARQIIALYESMPQAAPVYEEQYDDEPQSQAG